MELYMTMPMPPGAFVDYRRRGLPVSPAGMRPELVKQGNQGRYKTELCRAFQDKGVCKYGEKCQVGSRRAAVCVCVLRSHRVLCFVSFCPVCFSPAVVFLSMCLLKCLFVRISFA
jgi:hypothetical protein